MRNTPLWKYCDAHFGARIRKHTRGESGAAMIMALLFTVMVILTLTIVTSVLVGQAIPFKTNKRTQQATYAAETGLEEGLSFLRSAAQQAKADGTYQAFFPTLNSQSDASMTNGRTDDPAEAQFVTAGGNTIVLDCVNQSHSDGSADLNSVMGPDAPKCATMSTVTTGTTHGSSTTDDYSAARITYRVEITYWKGDPSVADSTGNPSAEKVSGMTDFTNARYALVTSKAYGTRYNTINKNGSQLPMITLQGIYKFGVTEETTGSSSGGGDGGASDGAFLIQANEMVNNYKWLKVVSYDENTITGYTTANDSLQQRQDYIDNPVNETCLVAADASGNVSPSYSPIAGSTVRVFQRATGDPSADGLQTYTRTEQCKSGGSYSHLNNWVYGADDTIRLSGTKLCITGVAIDWTKRNLTDNKGLATLQPCGNGYSPAVSSNGSKVNLAANQYGYDREVETNDKSSALNKLQKWSFYFGFINAAYSKKGESQLATGTIRQGGSEQVAFQTMNYYKGSVANVQTGWAGAAISSGYCSDTSACYLSTYWGTELSKNGHYEKPERTFLQSLGNGGEAGYYTEQVVSNSGTCMQVRPEKYSVDAPYDVWGTKNVVTKQCYVNAAPLIPFCYQATIGGQQSYPSSYSLNNTVCGANTDTADGIARPDKPYLNGTKADYISYDRPSEDSKVYPVTLQSTEGCLHVTSVDSNGILQYGTSPCSSSLGNDYQFIRTEFIGNDSRFNYKFILKSSLSDGYTESVLNDSSKNSGALCLQEVLPGTSLYQYGENGLVDTGNAEVNTADMFPYVQLQPCAASQSDVYSDSSTPQQWNAPTSEQGRWSHHDGATTTTTTTTELQSSSSGFMKVREYNLDALCTDSAPVSGTAAKGYSCWTV